MNQLTTELGPQATQTLGQFVQPYDQDQFQGLFKQSFIDPAMMAFEQDVLPSIYQSFGDQNAGSSSALNQALARSARDLTTSLGSQFGNFHQQQQQNQLGGLGILANTIGQKQIQPIIQQGYNPAGDIIGALGQTAAGAAPTVLGKLL